MYIIARNDRGREYLQSSEERSWIDDPRLAQQFDLDLALELLEDDQYLLEVKTQETYMTPIWQQTYVIKRIVKSKHVTAGNLETYLYYSASHGGRPRFIVGLHNAHEFPTEKWCGEALGLLKAGIGLTNPQECEYVIQRIDYYRKIVDIHHDTSPQEALIKLA